MAKIILLITFTAVLCSATSAAQMHIDSTQMHIDSITYEKMLNYWSCKYTAAYIEFLIQQPNDYTCNSIEEDIKNISIDISLSYEQLEEILRKKSCFGTVTLQKDYYNNVERKWNNSFSTLSLEEIKNKLTIQTTYGKKIKFETQSETTDLLQNEFDAYMMNICKSSQPKEIEKNDSDSGSSSKDIPKKGEFSPETIPVNIFVISCIAILITLLSVGIKYFNTIRNKNLEEIFYGVIILILILLLILKCEVAVLLFLLLLLTVDIFCFVRKHKTNTKNSIVAKEAEVSKGAEANKMGRQEKSKKTEPKDNEDVKTVNENEQPRKENDQLRKEGGSMQYEQRSAVESKKDQVYNDDKQSTLSSEPIVKVAPQKVIPLYANAIINGIFNKVTELANEDTVYTLLRKASTDKIAKFTVDGCYYSRVIACPDLLDGCDTQYISNNPTALQVEAGEAAQDDFGKWRITKKARIEFI
jgi:hypothetical protein